MWSSGAPLKVDFVDDNPSAREWKPHRSKTGIAPQAGVGAGVSAILCFQNTRNSGRTKASDHCNDTLF
jgi:hypothetical protein